MFQKFAITFVVTICSIVSFSQDKLLLKNGDLLNVKVIEINSKEVKYQVKQGDNYGPLIVMSIDNIQTIQYANGTEENLLNIRSEKADLTKSHLIEFNPADLIFNNINFNYEYYPNSKRDYSILVPLRVGVAPSPFHTSLNNILETGVGFLAYPYRNKRVNFFTGIELAYQFKKYGQTVYSGPPYYYPLGYIETNNHYLGAYSTTGMRINILPRVGLSYSFSLGFNKELTGSDNNLIGKFSIAAFMRF